MTQRRSWFVLVLAVVSALLGCGDSVAGAGSGDQAAAPSAQPPVAPPAPAPKAPAAAAPTDKVEDPTFVLAATPVGTYASGKLGSVAISLTPRGKYHVNQDYPMSIALSGDPALQFPKAQMGKAESAEFTENVARFDVPVTPQAAGKHALTARVKFAVCTPETCVPDERTLALALAVE
jgi:hypothetical protein